MFWILGMAVALGVGVYVGMGTPGLKGREDRVVNHGTPRRLGRKHIDWLRPDRR